MDMDKTRYHQVKRIWFVLPFYLFTFLPLSAQTYTQRIQKQDAGRATVTIHQSDSIDQLVNSELLGNRGARPTNPGNSSNPSTSSNSSVTSPTSPTGQDEGTQQPRATYKAVGYRVQAFAGGNSRADRQKAERIKSSIKSYYPNVPVYVHFFSPRRPLPRSSAHSRRRDAPAGCLPKAAGNSCPACRRAFPRRRCPGRFRRSRCC